MARSAINFQLRRDGAGKCPKSTLPIGVDRQLTAAENTIVTRAFTFHTGPPNLRVADKSRTFDLAPSLVHTPLGIQVSEHGRTRQISFLAAALPPELKRMTEGGINKLIGKF